MDFITAEDWIITRLKTDVPALKSVETFAGQIEGDMEKTPFRSPSAFVAYKGSMYQWLDGPNYQETPTFSVLLVVKSHKPDGSGGGPGGAYNLIRDIMASLTNSRPSPDMEMVQPLGSQLVFQNNGLFAYGMDFKTAFDTSYQW